MVEGLWTVEFRGSMGNSGTGVVILRDGKIGGGDAGYYYTGSYSIEDNSMQAVLEIKRYHKVRDPIFGPMDHLQLTLSGKVDGATLSVSGQTAGINVNVSGIRRESF